MAERILVVDDNEVMLSLVGLQLEAHGFVVVTSADAQHGFKILVEARRERRPYDLLITDLNMPCNRGSVLIQAFRDLEESEGLGEDERLPILVYTGVDLATIPQRERDDLMRLDVAFLSKEHGSDELISTVRSLLHP